jgi:hypothetical protein
MPPSFVFYFASDNRKKFELGRASDLALIQTALRPSRISNLDRSASFSLNEVDHAGTALLASFSRNAFLTVGR